MKVLETGHIYEPAIRKVEQPTGKVTPFYLTFINKQPGQEHDGTTTQEIIRILIDRTRHCNNCQPHRNNEQVIYHLRMALIMHEARALERKTEKGDFMPEYIAVGADGHFAVDENEPQPLDTPILEPYRNDWDRPCNHPQESEK